MKQNLLETIRNQHIEAGLWRDRSHLIALEPFALTQNEIDELEKLGTSLLSFYTAINDLYLKSEFDWVNHYLDLGKSEEIIRISKIKYQKNALPGIIRPDILIQKDGSFKITELDSVPGGFGHLDLLNKLYSNAGFNVVGKPDSVSNLFYEMLEDKAGKKNPVCAIVVSDESKEYFPEMNYLAGELRANEVNVWAVHPKEIVFTEDGFFIKTDDQEQKLDLIYRFYELFDLLNIPKHELLAYAYKKKTACVTPPYKHFLEEKMLLAFAHHPALKDFFEAKMGEDNFNIAKAHFSETQILDTRPVPSHALISFDNKTNLQNWMQLAEGTQKDRQYVIKPSGYCELAWGSRGVSIGHDLSKEEWIASLQNGLNSFNKNPYVIQPFLETKLFDIDYFNPQTETCGKMQARIRLCPYYFITNNKAKLAGVLATGCPKDKKIIHGMSDAIIMPCCLKD